MFTLLTEEALIPRLGEALALQRAEEWEAAETLYYALLAKRPADPLLLYHLGTLYSRMGNNYAAVEVLRYSVAQQPDFVPAYLELADALCSLGSTQEAITVDRRSNVLDAGQTEAVSGFGIALAPRREEREEAVARR